VRNAERNVLAVVVAVTAAGCIAVAAAIGRAGRPGGDDLLTAAVLAALIVIARRFPLQIAFRRRMVTDGAPMFAAVLLLAPAVAIVSTLLAVAVAEFTVPSSTGRDLRQVAFNTAQAVLGVAAGSAAYGALASVSLPSSQPSVMWGALAAAGAMIAAGDALVFVVVWAQLGLRFRRMAWDWIRSRADLPYDGALYAAGLVAAIAASIHVWLLLLLVVPTPVLYRAMKNQLALRQQTREAVQALADIVDERDPYTFGHCKRVAEFSRAICAAMGLSPDLTDEIVLAARVHDVGKIGIRDSVLLKPERLTDEEFGHIKEHPEIGARLTARFPDFAKGTRYIRHHHERWDGTGYPAGLHGASIPLGARIIAVADTYDAMSSTRVYRGGLEDEVIRAEMARVAGQQLDPDVVRAWFAARGWDGSGTASERAA
jgi:hypothetical protein